MPFKSEIREIGRVEEATASAPSVPILADDNHKAIFLDAHHSFYRRLDLECDLEWAEHSAMKFVKFVATSMRLIAVLVLAIALVTIAVALIIPAPSAIAEEPCVGLSCWPQTAPFKHRPSQHQNLEPVW